MSSNDKKVVVVTGASRGIGQQILKSIATNSQEYIVIGTATSEAGQQKISAELQHLDNSGTGLILDLSQPESITNFVKEVNANFAAPSILINNAGITSDNLFMRLSDAAWNAVINTNLTGTFYLTRALVKGMLKSRWGRIVNIGSVVASSGNPGQANYCAAKAGLIGLTKSLGIEIASRGITVNVVSPGFIATDMTDVLSAEQQQKILEQIPMRRMGEPEDIATAVKFLISEHANYITGQTMHVNGGMFMP